MKSLLQNIVFPLLQSEPNRNFRPKTPNIAPQQQKQQQQNTHFKIQNK